MQTGRYGEQGEGGGAPARLGSPERAAYVGFYRYGDGEPAIWMYRRVPFIWTRDYWRPMFDSGLFREEAERIDEREYRALLDQRQATDARDVFPPMEDYDPDDWGDDQAQEKVTMPDDPLPEYRNRTAYVGFYKFSDSRPVYWGRGYLPRVWNGEQWFGISDLNHFQEEADRIDEAEFVALLAQWDAPDPRKADEARRQEREERECPSKYVNLDSYVGVYRYSGGEPAIWLKHHVPQVWSVGEWRAIYDSRHFDQEADRISEPEFAALLVQHGATGLRDPAE